MNDLPTPCYAAAWDGGTWSPVGESSSVIGAISAFLPFDVGNGTQLIAGGGNGVCIWNGSEWLRLGGSIHGGTPAVRAISIADPDLEDSAPSHHPARRHVRQPGTGRRSTTAHTSRSRAGSVGRRELETLLLDRGLVVFLRVLCFLRRRPRRWSPPALYVSGQFSSGQRNRLGEHRTLRLRSEENIPVLRPTGRRDRRAGETVRLPRRDHRPGRPPLLVATQRSPARRWARAGGGVISAPFPTLRIDGVNYEDQGLYDLVVDRRCDNASSGMATLNVRCPADFNDDDVVDFFDYLGFVSAFEAGDDAADFNHDSVVDFFDYLDFMAAFIGAVAEQGGCAFRIAFRHATARSRVCSACLPVAFVS